MRCSRWPSIDASAGQVLMLAVAKWSASLQLLLGFSGCAQKALMQNMTVKHLDKQTLDSNYQNAISIQSTSGGTETSSIGASQIDNDEFKKAVVASLINAGLYSKDGKYKLKIEIYRFWRTIKYEEVYLNEYKNIKALNRAIEKYMNSYNQRRLHSAIGYKTPNEVYYQADNNLDAKGVKPLPLVS